MLSTTTDIDIDLRKFTGKFLPKLILAVGTAVPHGLTLEQIALRDFWLKMYGPLYKCRKELYWLASIKYPQRLDRVMQPYVRSELCGLDADTYLLRDVHREFAAMCDRLLAELSASCEFDKDPVADPRRCANELRRMVQQKLDL